jgi:hypothetical protein
MATLSLPLAAAAQEQMSGPPPMLVINREDIKTGSMDAHNKQVVSYLALFSRANVGGYRLGLTSVSGDDNQIIYLEGYPSFAEFEATQKKMDETFAASPALQGELDALNRATEAMHASQTTALAVYRADLSFRPTGMEGVAKSRYFTVTTSRVKPGRGNDYEEWVKQFNRAREKANLDEHSAIYQVVSGAQAGTYMSFVPYRSLAEWDTFTKGMQARNKSIDDAVGGDIVVKQRREMAEAIFAFTQSNLYAFSPKISRPAAQFAAADPDFWSPKAAGKALATKKETKK